MKKKFWMLALLFAIEVSVLLLLVPGEWTKKVINKEATYVERSLGEASVQWIHESASSWYRAGLLETNALEIMRRWVIPTKKQREKSRGIENMGVQFFDWWETRIDALSALAYQVLARFALLLMWLPYIVILIVPALFDGYMTWKIKRTNFDYASPIVHRYSSRGVTMLSFGLLVLFFLPLAIDPIVVPFVMMVVAVLMGLSVGNLQKRI